MLDINVSLNMLILRELKDFILPSYIPFFWGFPGGSVIKNLPASAGNMNSVPGLGRSPGGGNDNSLQYSFLENPHGHRSLTGYSPGGCKALDMTEQLMNTLSLNFFCFP